MNFTIVLRPRCSGPSERRLPPMAEAQMEDYQRYSLPHQQEGTISAGAFAACAFSFGASWKYKGVENQ
ncbi:hypothetical protein [Niabella ginsenosidivorans]|uniref:hypothetical protein n=1 Tax=Niabella ginsenosidivorans TaxID=1176587 RepID=UPI0012EDC0EB|nr:hypothetical protein [Niabella ginsenosidivorans]